jgi:hypothetical protein
MKIDAVRKFDCLFFGNLHFAAGERGGFLPAFASNEFQEYPILMEPEALDLGPVNLRIALEANSADSAESIGKVGEYLSRDFSLDTPGPGNPRDGDELIQLLKNLQYEAFVQLHACRPQQRPNRSCGTSLLPNHFAQIGLGYAQFQKNRCLFSFHREDSHSIRIIHQGLSDLFY